MADTDADDAGDAGDAGDVVHAGEGTCGKMKGNVDGRFGEN